MKNASTVSALGFTLVEMAIVLLILGLLLGGGLTVLSAQIEQQKVKDTQKVLDDAKEALIGYAIANGRLPCPAAPGSTGVESPLGGGACTNPWDGFLPAATLGLPGVDTNGYLVDAWQLPQNRIRYAVTTANAAPPANTNAATTTNRIQSISMVTFQPDLYVCSTSTGITGAGTAAAACPVANRLTNTAVAVIFSLGKNAPLGGAGADELANLNADRVFVSHRPVSAGGANGEFDDMFTWLPSSILFNRMLQAGRLP